MNEQIPSPFWDERYSQEEFIYGKEPNEYFKEELGKLAPGTILLPAEGEGRNGIYAAKCGWTVYAFDSSSVAREKAIKFASESNVSINYEVSEFKDFNTNVKFDAIALIFNHLPEDKRTALFTRFISYLKPGGKIIMEAFSKKQFGNNTGGPGDISLLYTIEQLKEYFSSLTIDTAYETDIILKEGKYHSGMSSVCRFTATK